MTGVFAEATADRQTGTPVGTGRITFTLMVTGDQFAGRAEAHFYDVNGTHIRGPLPTALHGQRITASFAALRYDTPSNRTSQPMDTSGQCQREKLVTCAAPPP